MEPYGAILYRLPEEIRRNIRDYERSLIKLDKAKQARVFNQTCINEGLFPHFSNITTHDKTVQNEALTVQYRKGLIERQLRKAEDNIIELSEKTEQVSVQLNQLQTQTGIPLDEVLQRLHANVDKERNKSANTIVKKLERLYNGTIVLPQERKTYVNISDYVLSKDEHDFLSLGMNVHLKPKFDPYKKRVELEKLYQDITDLHRDGYVNMNDNLKDQLKAEGTKNRSRGNRSILPPNLRNAAKQLRSNEEIVIRKADKSNAYVIVNRQDYEDKLDRLVSDESKFTHITRNPINALKKELNGLIKTANMQQKYFNVVEGDYSEGYLYGNPKTHKQGYPLRPIISQVLTPTYHVAKSLDKLIKAYLPYKYNVKSRDEFLDLLYAATLRDNVKPISLDVESLFTNVPVVDTIDIIIRQVYSHESLAPPLIEPNTLREMLILCTTKVPFRNINGKLYLQTNGVSMGSPLGPTFADYYMCHLESTVIDSLPIKPIMYCRYVDDIFMLTDDNTMLRVKEAFESNSVLKFTHELPVNNKLAFLDVLVNYDQFQGITTSVYRKPTNEGNCLNEISECPLRYKVSVLTNFLKRAYKVSSNWTLFNVECARIKQIMVNNGYSNSFVDENIKRFINRVKQDETETQPNTGQCKKLFYCNQYSSNYKDDERVLKKLITNNVKTVKAEDRLKFVIFYQNRKTRDLVMKNNTAKVRTLAKTNLIYEFTCPINECIRAGKTKYVGFTTCSLSRRLSLHLQNGSIKEHFANVHHCKISRSEIVDNTNVRYFERNVRNLKILEALIIKFETPTVNSQDTGFHRTLALYQ